jgi:hypothetical protein
MKRQHRSIVEHSEYEKNCDLPRTDVRAILKSRLAHEMSTADTLAGYTATLTNAPMRCKKPADAVTRLRSTGIGPALDEHPVHGPRE